MENKIESKTSNERICLALLLLSLSIMSIIFLKNLSELNLTECILSILLIIYIGVFLTFIIKMSFKIEESETFFTPSRKQVRFIMDQKQITDDVFKQLLLKNNGDTPLISAIVSNNEPMLQWLLNDLKVDINEFSTRGRTAVSWAIKTSNYKFLRILIRSGARLDQHTVVSKIKIDDIEQKQLI